MSRKDARRRALSVTEIDSMAESIRQLLEDPQVHLDRDTRLRWEGALTALEAVLAQPSSLAPHLDLKQLL